MTISRDLLRLELAESLATTTPELTRRAIRLPEIPGKALAIVGVRRGGKTSFLGRDSTDSRASVPVPELGAILGTLGLG